MEEEEENVSELELMMRAQQREDNQPPRNNQQRQTTPNERVNNPNTNSQGTNQNTNSEGTSQNTNFQGVNQNTNSQGTNNNTADNPDMQSSYDEHNRRRDTRFYNQNNPATDEDEEDANTPNQPNTRWIGMQNLAQDFKHLFIKPHRCPYCFRYVKKKQNFNELRVQLGRHIRQTQTENNQNGNANAEHVRTKIYYCETCERDLPADFFANKSLSLAIVGGVNTGKSTFITVLLDLLQSQNALTSELGIGCSIVNDTGRQFYLRQRGQLIDGKMTLHKTSTPEDPILIKLESFNNTKKTIYLTFYDTRGEEFESPRGILERHPNVIYADGLIFLLNPLDSQNIYHYVKEELASDETLGKDFSAELAGDYNPSLNNFNVKIIENINQAFLWSNRTKPNRPIKTPVAFCLMQADILEQMGEITLEEDFEEDYSSLRELKMDIDASSEETIDFLNDNDSILFQNINKFFSLYRLFPVAPMGVPSKGGQYTSYNPKGVLKPIVWLLDNLKFFN